MVREMSRELMEENQVDETLLIGHAEAWLLMYGFVNSLVLKCVVDLHIADIIHSHGRSITLSQIASGILDSPSTNIEYLARIVRYLVHKKIFTAHRSSDGGETLYGLNPTSACMLRDSKLTLVPLILFTTDSFRETPWYRLSQCIKYGGSAFRKAYGSEIFDFASKATEFNDKFNDAMKSLAKIMLGNFLSVYKDELSCIGSLVDVGGGTGAVIAEIVKSYPHIRGTNFDLPHVIATAPEYDGVYHVGGDMFEAIPKADAIITKWVLHDWSDADCVKILKNCRKAIPEKTGKVIILDVVLEPDTNGDIFDEVPMLFDLLMMVYSPSRKERTGSEWKKLIEEGGFSRYKITKLASALSIVEAFPV